MSGMRRNRNTCGQQYDPFMFGNRKGFGVGGMNVSMTAMSQPPQQQQRSNYSYPPPSKSASLNDATVSVRECMYWPASLNYQKNLQYQTQQQRAYLQQTMAPSQGVYNSSGDAQFCSAPPKVYMTVPGMNGRKAQNIQQNIPCQIAPLGTDPMSMIKPLAPMTVRVQAPADLFAGNPEEPKTITISPADLYGQMYGARR